MYSGRCRSRLTSNLAIRSKRIKDCRSAAVAKCKASLISTSISSRIWAVLGGAPKRAQWPPLRGGAHLSNAPERCSTGDTVPKEIEDEESWLRHHIMRMRTILRFAKDPRTEAGIGELISDAEARLAALEAKPSGTANATDAQRGND